jgi:tRNA (cytidine/uridine-2'-O-)-methyltransferase
MAVTVTNKKSLHVVLVEPEIHWNTGNAGRSCLAAGAQLHLVEPLGFSLDEKAVRRAGLDYWPKVQPVVWRDWPQFEEKLPEIGEPYFISPEAPRRLWEVDLREPLALLFGSETRGLATTIRDKYRDRLLSIPMEGADLRSLNLSTCVGIALYEVMRQRLHGGTHCGLR